MSPAGPTVDRPGALLDGRFRLERQIGTGREGVVWLAWDEHRSREVAVKSLHSGQRSVSDDKLREVKALRALKHPHVARLLEIAVDGERPLLILEHIDGQRLDRELYVRAAAGRPLRRRMLAVLFDQMCAAVGAAHEAAIVHRDLKPANMVLAGTSDAPHLTVMDFGLARVMGESSDQRTTRGRVLGSYAYMAPEQARGEPVTPASDVFALGCIMFELATLHRAWERDGEGRPLAANAEHPAPPMELSKRIAEEPAPSLCALREDLPAKLDELIQSAMAKDPADRPATASELRRRIAAITQTWRKPKLDAQRGSTTPRRNSFLQVRALAMGAVALAGFALYFTSTRPMRSGPGTDSSPAVVAIPATPKQKSSVAPSVDPAPPPQPPLIERRPASPTKKRDRGRAVSNSPPEPSQLERLLAAARRDPGDAKPLSALARALRKRAQSLPDRDRSQRFERLIESSVLVSDLDELEQIMRDLERPAQ